MRLLTYTLAPEHAEDRIGLSVTIGGAELIIDVAKAQARYLASGASSSANAKDVSVDSLRGDMRLLLDGGSAALQALGLVETYAKAELASEATREAWLKDRVAHSVEDIRWRPPIPRPGKIIMIGGNYTAHRAERNDKAKGQLPDALLNEPPPVPPAFAKFSSTLVGNESPIIYPFNSAQFDYETELCVVIGKRCKDVPADQFTDVVAGYIIGNDVSMRDLQFAEMKRGSTMLGKNLDTAMPMGPYLVTADEVGDAQNLSITCWVNGELRQQGTTRDMTCSIGGLIQHYSRLTLEPGDIIATGTPSGVGIFWDPPEHGLLRVGDVIEMEIEKLGRLRNVVVAENEDVANDPRKRPRSE